MPNGHRKLVVGSLVRPAGGYSAVVPSAGWAFRNEGGPAVGIVIGWDEGEPVVFWNEEFPEEIEYRHQLEVISCSTRS